MIENIKLVSSIVWLLAGCCMIAGALLLIGTWGGFLYFFVWSLGIWVIASAAVVITSL